MEENKVYDEFVEKYANFAKDLYKQAFEKLETFPKTVEHPLYNQGTMERDSDVQVSPNIYLMSATDFEKRFAEKNTKIDEQDRKAMVVFDYLKENGSKFSFEENGNDFLFKENGKDVDRKAFYSGIYKNALSNTCYYNRNIGDLQIIALPNNKNKLPGSARGLPDKYMKQVDKIYEENPTLLPEIFLKRGLYHEATHAAMGTDDERKCDTFAMLKIIKEHPKEAELICNIYKFARSKSEYTIKNLHSNSENDYARRIKNGAATYLMPNTYKKLEAIAKNPELLKSCKTDASLMKLTYELTKEPEFTSKDLEQFAEILKNKYISRKDLENSNIIKACVTQSGAKDFNEYISSVDKNLGEFLNEQDSKKKEEITLRFDKAKETIASRKDGYEEPKEIEAKEKPITNIKNSTENITRKSGGRN